MRCIDSRRVPSAGVYLWEPNPYICMKLQGSKEAMEDSEDLADGCDLVPSQNLLSTSFENIPLGRRRSVVKRVKQWKAEKKMFLVIELKEI